MRGKQCAHRRKKAICSKTDERQEYKTEPSDMYVDQRNLTPLTLDVLLFDVSFFAHLVKGIHKELSGDG